MKPTLLLLAAGMGSRYGGLKQLDGLGPNGETIMDYSIFDAIKAGFGKIVFVIRKDFEDDFRNKILSKYEGHVPVELCFQSLDALPEGFQCPADRVKPWGTNHAVMMAKDVIKEPFCVINCDDFYNRDAFQESSSPTCPRAAATAMPWWDSAWVTLSPTTALWLVVYAQRMPRAISPLSLSAPRLCASMALCATRMRRASGWPLRTTLLCR